MEMPLSEHLVLAGPAGALEARLERPPQAEPCAAALVCHPHPLHGGTLENKVVYTLGKAFVALGAATLRLNFRGVGQSQGEFDNGVGETDDALAAVAELRSRWPALPLCVAGFSFGAGVAARVAQQLEVAILVTVAPPVGRFGFPQDAHRDRWLVVHGSADTLIDVDAVVAWLDRLPPGPELVVINGADHFFHGRLNELKSSVIAFAGPLLAGKCDS